MSLKNNADTLLKMATEAGDVPGVVATATTGEGTIYEGRFGSRKLVEQGKLELDAPASEVLPELGEVVVLEGFGEDGQPRTRQPKRPITLRHLLTHTAGFGHEFWNADVVSYQQLNGLPPIISCLNATLQIPLLFDPGERWE